MKLLVPALFALLSPVVLASQNICHPPKSTTIGFLALSEAHSYTVNDYEKGIVYFAPAGDIFGEPWEYVDLNANITYRKESGQDCVYEALDPGLREVYQQCIPGDAKLYGEIDGHPMYLVDRPGSFKWLKAVTPIKYSPYYWRFITRFEWRGSLKEVGIVYINHLDVLEPSLFDKDLSLCAAAK